MNFGEKLKQLRSEQELTQPELAEKIGIEQSYLSKLENGKSFPSADNFQLILEAFSIKTETLLEGVEPSQVFKQLRQIPQVSRYLEKHHKQQKTQQRRWLLTSALCFVIGLTAFLSGKLALIYPETYFNYHSPGIVLDGESKEIFKRWRQTIRSYGNQAQQEENEALRLKMVKRRNENYILTTNYRGNSYNISVEGGSRTYSLNNGDNAQQGIENIERRENHWLVLFGILFLALGISGFILERKLNH